MNKKNLPYAIFLILLYFCPSGKAQEFHIVDGAYDYFVVSPWTGEIYAKDHWAASTYFIMEIDPRFKSINLSNFRTAGCVAFGKKHNLMIRGDSVDAKLHIVDFSAGTDKVLPIKQKSERAIKSAETRFFSFSPNDKYLLLIGDGFSERYTFADSTMQLIEDSAKISPSSLSNPVYSWTENDSVLILIHKTDWYNSSIYAYNIVTNTADTLTRIVNERFNPYSLGFVYNRLTRNFYYGTTLIPDDIGRIHAFSMDNRKDSIVFSAPWYADDTQILGEFAEFSFSPDNKTLVLMSQNVDYQFNLHLYYPASNTLRSCRNGIAGWPKNFYNVVWLNNDTLLYETPNAYLSGFALNTFTAVKELKTGQQNKAEMMLSNYPNPFNGQTVIKYSLKNPGRVTLAIVDILGREVWKKDMGYVPAGEHSSNWNARSAANQELVSGLYIAKISVEDFEGKSFSRSIKLLLTK